MGFHLIEPCWITHDCQRTTRRTHPSHRRHYCWFIIQKRKKRRSLWKKKRRTHRPCLIIDRRHCQMWIRHRWHQQHVGHARWTKSFPRRRKQTISCSHWNHWSRNRWSHQSQRTLTRWIPHQSWRNWISHRCRRWMLSHLKRLRHRWCLFRLS